MAQEKAKKEENKTWSIVKKVLNIATWALLILWMLMVISDFCLVKAEKEPKFCWFNKNTSTYNDGTVTECTGVGYKVIRYERESLNAYEFGPFWIQNRTK